MPGVPGRLHGSTLKERGDAGSHPAQRAAQEIIYPPLPITHYLIFIESQNHRVSRVGRDPQGAPNPDPGITQLNPKIILRMPLAVLHSQALFWFLHTLRACRKQRPEQAHPC